MRVIYQASDITEFMSLVPGVGFFIDPDRNHPRRLIDQVSYVDTSRQLVICPT